MVEREIAMCCHDIRVLNTRVNCVVLVGAQPNKSVQSHIRNYVYDVSPNFH